MVGLAFDGTTEVVRAYPTVTATLTPQTVFNFPLFSAPRTICREQTKLLLEQYVMLEDGRALAG